MYTWCTRRWNFKIVKKSSPRIRHVLWARWIYRGVECCDMIRTVEIEASDEEAQEEPSQDCRRVARGSCLEPRECSPC